MAEPETIATAIRIGNPRSWKKSLRGVRDTGGQVLDVTDEEIAEAKEVIGRDGIGCEPASAATVAGLRKLRAGKQIPEEAQRGRHPYRPRPERYQFHYPRSPAGGSTCALLKDVIVYACRDRLPILGRALTRWRWRSSST